MVPQVRILSAATFQPLFELDEYTALVYHRRWQDLDDFELHFSGDSSQGSRLISSGIVPSHGLYILNVILDGTSDFAGFIDTCEGAVLKGKHEWKISGRGLDRILADRVILPPAGLTHDSYSGLAETIMKQLVTRHVITPFITSIPELAEDRRIIPNLIVETDLGHGTAYNFEGRFQVLDEALREIARGGGDLGFSVVIVGSQLVFRVSSGVDRSASAIFSTTFGNVDQFQYTEDGLDSSNVVVVAGQGEQLDRIVLVRGAAGIAPVGSARREMFVDARDLGEPNAITKLENRGDSKLVAGFNKSFSVTLASGIRPFYKTDWDVGDTVTIRHDPWGINQAEKIYEVEVSLTAGSDPKITPSLSKQLLSFKERIGQVNSATGRT